MIIVRSDQLQHHGILGQKWGIRRFQNPDGSLTPDGRERYRVLTSNGFKSKLDSQPLVNKRGKRIIKKGTTFNRVALKNEPIDSRRKYVTVTDHDKKMYERFARDGAFGGTVFSRRKYEYTAIKDINVADAKTVLDHLVTTYGDRKMSDAYSVYKNLENVPRLDRSEVRKQGGTKEDVKLAHDVNKAYHKAAKTLKEFSADSLFRKEKISSEVLQHFASKGYDAIVDSEDWFMTIVDFPLILINPKESIELKSETKLGLRDRG